MEKKKSTEQKAFDVCYLIIGAFKKGEDIGAIEWSDLEECHKAAIEVRRELKRRVKAKKVKGRK